jgi:hypothetical protein
MHHRSPAPMLWLSVGLDYTYGHTSVSVRTPTGDSEDSTAQSKEGMDWQLIYRELTSSGTFPM